MKKLILFAGSFGLLSALTLACFFGRPCYQRFSREQALRHARAFLLSGDFADASLSARQVLQADSHNPDACRIMAEIAEACHSPAALDWRQRAAEFSPSLPDRLKLAATGLRFERPPFSFTTQVLRGLQPLGENLAGFHSLRAELALKLNEIAEATVQLEKAVRLDPTNQLYRFNLAVLGLQSTNQQTVVRAKADLERLSTNSDLRLPALRWRIAELSRRNDLAGAESLSAEALACNRAGLQDRLQHLAILQLERSLSFQSYLKKVQSGVGSNLVDVYSVSQWMGAHGLANEALSWLAGFDSKTREAQPISLAVANLNLAKADWGGLENCLANQRWAEHEFLRLAYLARASFGQEHQTAGEARWQSAVEAAAGRLGPLCLLLGLANEWGRDPEDLLWEIGRRFPRETWALVELERRYSNAGNTRGLNRIYNLLTSSGTGTSDLRNQNNLASSSLLLRINLPQAHLAAGELYRRQPDDPFVGSTYAYSLHLQGRTQDALAVFARLKPAAREIPSIALYYGVLLSSAGHADQAARFIALAETAKLLPEERQLLDEAQGRALKFR